MKFVYFWRLLINMVTNGYILILRINFWFLLRNYF